MGNILETDSSVSSENEAEDYPVPEVRTEGDGMETEKLDNGVEGNAHIVISSGVPSTVSDPHSVLVTQKKNSPLYDRMRQLEGATPRFSAAESPKQLPPRDKLIVLKPSKLHEKSNGDTAATHSKGLTTSSKQSREPKFVPYEPYKGATRSMVEDIKCHSRKASIGSTNSLGSAESNKLEASNAPLVPQSDSVSNQQYLTQTVRGAQKFGESDDNLNQSQSVMLLKERLRIQEKDILELRTENSRLKKMLVDSLAGFGSSSATNYIPLGHSSFQVGVNGNTISESVDNLNDEIEVWRSKFLSSCVLVEQLTKENQDWKNRTCSAVELFREIKQNTEVSLTPTLFDKINSWLHHFTHNAAKPFRGAQPDPSNVYNEHDICISSSLSS